MRTLFAISVVLFAVVQPAPLRGTWTASIGSTPSFHGTWSADLDPKALNAATGSWTLLDGSNRIVAEGTWSAVKTPGAWSGTWSARILPPGGRGGGSGRIRSGKWRADIAAGAGTSLSEMLQSTLQKQITGAWQSAGLQGRWWLSGSS